MPLEILGAHFLIRSAQLVRVTRLQCFDAVGWAAGRASGV